MLGLGTDDESDVDETWNEMVEEVERAAAERVQKEREPFRFHVFRDDSGQVTQWALLSDKTVDGVESRVPVTVGSTGEGPSTLWMDYHSRFNGERERNAIFEFVEKEDVVPSNQFWNWLSECVEAVAAFNTQLEEIDDQSAFGNISPDLPPLYDDICGYEKQALNFFGEILIEHRNYTEEQGRLIYEAVRRYDVDDETWEQFTGEAFDNEEDE